MELKREDKVKVTNRSNATVILRVPDRHFRAELNPGETRPLTYGDILDVAARPGGRALIYNFLLIHSQQVIREGLNLKEEPEYWLTEEKLLEWMPVCSLDEFKDALNFAPEGVKDLIKKYAVSMPLKDTDKRDAIKEFLNFDVNMAISNNEKSKDTSSDLTNNNKRRSSSVSFEVPNETNETNETNATGTAPKYKRTATTTTI